MSDLIPLRASDGSIRAHARVDREDFAALARWTWSLDARGYVCRNERVAGGWRIVLLHRQIMGFPACGVDHRNGDQLDNRRSNLRLATTALNAQNRPRLNANNTSGYRGVSFDKQTGEWSAQVRLDGRLHKLGRHATPELADEAARGFRAEHMPYSAEAA